MPQQSFEKIQRVRYGEPPHLSMPKQRQEISANEPILWTHFENKLISDRPELIEIHILIFYHKENARENNNISRRYISRPSCIVRFHEFAFLVTPFCVTSLSLSSSAHSRDRSPTVTAAPVSVAKSWFCRSAIICRRIPHLT